MVENITECGEMGSSMERAHFLVKKKIVGKKEFGMKEKELDGLLNDLILKEYIF